MGVFFKSRIWVATGLFVAWSASAQPKLPAGIEHAPWLPACKDRRGDGKWIDSQVISITPAPTRFEDNIITHKTKYTYVFENKFDAVLVRHTLVAELFPDWLEGKTEYFISGHPLSQTRMSFRAAPSNREVRIQESRVEVNLDSPGASSFVSRCVFLNQNLYWPASKEVPAFGSFFEEVK